MGNAVSVRMEYEYVMCLPSSVAWSAAAFTKLFLWERHSMISTTMRVPNMASSRLASHWKSLWGEGREGKGGVGEAEESIVQSTG
jgi:hypothetical protein